MKLSTVHGHVDNMSTRDPRGARRVTNPSDLKNSGEVVARTSTPTIRHRVPASSTLVLESHTLG
jgi:Icc-related predicted phosphoesterase